MLFRILASVFLLMPAIAKVQDGTAPLRPQSGTWNLVLEENLRFGADESDDHYLWTGDDTSVTADDRGFIYVCDSGANRILMFDDQGLFVRQVARKGEGPGEFEGAPSLFILKDGSAIGFDNVPNSMPKLNFFDKDMGFQRQDKIIKEPIPNTAYFSPSGDKFLTRLVISDDNDESMLLQWAILDDKLKVLKTLTGHRRPYLDPAQFGNPGYWSELLGKNLKQHLTAFGFAAFSAQGPVYTAGAPTYEITKWNPDLTQKLAVLKHGYKPIPYKQEDVDALVDTVMEKVLRGATDEIRRVVSQAVIAKAVERAEIPPVRPPIYGLLLTEDGHLLVVRDIRWHTRLQVADIFSPQGDFLGQTQVGNHAFYHRFDNRPQMSFRKGFAYTVETNEDDELEVVRYSYKFAEKE